MKLYVPRGRSYDISSQWVTVFLAILTCNIEYVMAECPKKGNCFLGWGRHSQGTPEVQQLRLTASQLLTTLWHREQQESQELAETCHFKEAQKWAQAIRNLLCHPTMFPLWLSLIFVRPLLARKEPNSWNSSNCHTMLCIALLYFILCIFLQVVDLLIV